MKRFILGIMFFYKRMRARWWPRTGTRRESALIIDRAHPYLDVRYPSRSPRFRRRRRRRRCRRRLFRGPECNSVAGRRETSTKKHISTAPKSSSPQHQKVHDHSTKKFMTPPSPSPSPRRRRQRQRSRAHPPAKLGGVNLSIYQFINVSIRRIKTRPMPAQEKKKTPKIFLPAAQITHNTKRGRPFLPFPFLSFPFLSFPFLFSTTAARRNLGLSSSSWSAHRVCPSRAPSRGKPGQAQPHHEAVEVRQQRGRPAAAATAAAFRGLSLSHAGFSPPSGDRRGGRGEGRGSRG